VTTEPLVGVRHPWCTDFEWQRAERPPRRLTKAQVQQFDNDGWLVVDDLLAPVRAGGAVVFSSLTPHRTGPNTTDAVRKTYILQFAPDGVEVLRGDPGHDSPTSRALQNDPDCQYLVLRDGEQIGSAI
jgi:ectoine hydroxylase-related dioxygenase (phytanoyl-CoA dioxygenase family)